MPPIELLAPARDLACGKAAIACGADAVYIGAPSFGAREAAGNSVADIAALASYAHLFWARVYVTINTLLRDEELPHAVRMAHELHRAGVDGLIIQDMGLLECDLPPLPLIASTQAHNASPEKVAFLAKVGFHRAILARELSIPEIKAIHRAAPDIELEFFIHGALCVSYSGQCYLSYALGGRSGNRGACAQPCRKPYDLQDANGRRIGRRKHYLSIKDLSLDSHLEDLLDAGVTSFKIEGRLKDENYVKNVVSHYRARLDEILVRRSLPRSSSGKSSVDFTPDLPKTFNRGFTSYFVAGRREAIGANDTPKMMGEPVGVVDNVRPAVALSGGGESALHPGDGICFFDASGNLQGTRVNKVENGRIVLEKISGLKRGTRIYRNRDHAFLGSLEKARITRRIEARLRLGVEEDGLRLEACDEDDNRAQAFLRIDPEPAQKPAEALDAIRSRLARSGDTEFEIGSIEIDLPVVPFLPAAALNGLRREVLERLGQARQVSRPMISARQRDLDAAYPEETLSWQGNVFNDKAKAFYTRHGVQSIEPAAESGLRMRGRRVMTTRYCLKYEQKWCPKHHQARIGEPLYLVDEDGNRLELRFDCHKCCMEVWLT